MKLNVRLLADIVISDHSAIIAPCRRVHITKETLDCLGDYYEVEEGHGGERNAYLKQHSIQTYLIVPGDTFKGSTPSTGLRKGLPANGNVSKEMRMMGHGSQHGKQTK